MPAVLGATTLASIPTGEGEGAPVCTIELLFLGPVPVGPRFPAAGVELIAT